MAAVLFAVFVLPFLVGRFLAKQFKMPSHGTQMGVVLATIVGCVIILMTNELRYGIDIIGGTDLIYEMDRKAMEEASKSGQEILAKDLVRPLNERINPAGTKELVIRPNGPDKIEIIIPAVQQMEVEEIKRLIAQAGILEFKIVANTSDHDALIKLARKQAENPVSFERLARDVVNEDGRVVALWREIDREDEIRNGVKALRTPIGPTNLARDAVTGRILPPYPGSNETNGFEKFLQRQGIEQVELLLALERGGEQFPVITGSDIASARVGTSQNGGYEVQFTMRTEGASKLYKLTTRNQPDPQRDFHRQMAILLDNRILSAPNLNQPISTNGVITGNFTRGEAEFLQKILQSGSLPAALNKAPISETQVGAELGNDAIRKGLWASILGLVSTAVFMLFYYRFSGIVACIALGINLLIILAFMVIIRQPITLPGLAGLVLSVGMSVDANVLVFERIREEIAKRSTGRLAIRNGFDRALTTIIDSNLTTLISAVVLYWIGEDQVRGFAITLIIGLVASMFTAVFCSRVIFEVGEKLRVVRFGMADIVAFMRKAFLGQKDVDFMGMRKVCYLLSGLAIVVGLVAPALRGRQFLDIDFAGGTQHIFVLDKPLPTDDVRGIVEKIFATDDEGLPISTTLTNVKLEEYGADRVFKLVTSLKDENLVSEKLVDGMNAESSGVKLLTYTVKTSFGAPKTTDESLIPYFLKLKYVAFQEEQPAAPETPAVADASTPAPAASETPSATGTAASDAPPTAPASETPVAQTSPASATTPPANSGNVPTPADATAVPASVTEKTSVELAFGSGKGDSQARINASGLLEKLIVAGKDVGLNLNPNQIQLFPKDAPEWTRDSDVGYPEWTVSLPLDEAKSRELISKFEGHLAEEPIWQSVSKIDSRVAGEMQTKAILALIISMVFIGAYIWFRFQKLSYGLAAIIALVHDVIITLAFVAISHWLFKPLGFLLIDDFKISLNMVAAFLTIIGYSLNDTIVVFDRIREVKGKAPRLTVEMINQSVNQTLGRTLLTSATTIFAIFLMYIFGGEAVHAFCYALLIGIVVGTYSSVFIAAPLLLWFAQREESKQAVKSI